MIATNAIVPRNIFLNDNVKIVLSKIVKKLKEKQTIIIIMY